MSISLWALAAFVGIVAGATTSLMGGSAVMIVVPILTIVFHLDAHMAIGTSLFVDVITSLVVAYSYNTHGNIKLKPGLWIAGASVVGAQLGVYLLSLMGENSLTSGFSLITFAVGAGMMVKAASRRKLALSSLLKGMAVISVWQKRLVCATIGFVIGVISGIFGAGGGIMILIALTVILGFPMHVAVGTSTLIMAITAFSSTAGCVARGYIDFPLGAVLTAGAVAGAIVGARFANRIGEKVLRYIAGGILVVIGVGMFLLKGS
jgi:uncharacterized protein